MTQHHFHHLRHHSMINKFLFGGLAITVGVVLLLLNFGYIEPGLKPAIFSWQMLLMLIGLISIFKRHFWCGTMSFFVGAFFIVPKLQEAGFFPALSKDFVQVYYPVLLIAGGVLLLIYWILPPKFKHHHTHWHHAHKHHAHHAHWQHYYSQKCTCGEDCTCKNCGCKEGECTCSDKKNAKKRTNCGCTLHKDIVFSGCNEVYLDEVFKGGEINVVFGGYDLDLRHTTLPEGDTYLDLNAVFSGIDLYIPNDWQVEIRADKVCSGFFDSRQIDETKIDHTRKLIINGSFVFSGGDIKN